MMQNVSISKIKVKRNDGLQNQFNIKPMSFKKSLLFFGIPALLMALSYYLLIPYFESLGISALNSFFAGHIIFMGMLIVATAVALKFEGDTFNLQDFLIRTRFNNFKLKYIIFAVGAFVVMSIGYGFFDSITKDLLTTKVLTIPSFVPIMGNPTITFDTTFLSSVVNGPVVGNWGIIVIFLTSLIFNIVGEELWWRGYILPRQELRFGKRTWIVHGFLWTFFHSFKYWDLLGLFPVCLIISYIAQKQKNNWTAFMAHFIFNGLMIFLLFPAVLSL